MARLGCKVPSAGDLPLEPGLARMATVAEAAGARSLWVADHVVQVRDPQSPYPYSPDKKLTRWQPDSPWFEALTTMAWLASATEEATIGSAVLVLPQRDPVLVAKTVSTLDQLSGGRIALGVGAGWLAEEFTALGWDFETRGGRMNEAIELLRACWTGFPDFEGEFFKLPDGVISLPAPAHPVPILVGGMTKAALARTATLGDGWLALTRFDTLDREKLSEQLARVKSLRPAGKPPLQTVIYILGEVDASSDEQLEVLSFLAGLRFDDVVIDVPWPDEKAVAASLAAAIAATA